MERELVRATSCVLRARTRGKLIQLRVTQPAIRRQSHGLCPVSGHNGSAFPLVTKSWSGERSSRCGHSSSPGFARSGRHPTLSSRLIRLALRLQLEKACRVSKKASKVVANVLSLAVSYAQTVCMRWKQGRRGHRVRGERCASNLQCLFAFFSQCPDRLWPSHRI
jgi:hypothetical protein